MPKFETFFLIQWMHWVALALGGGGAVAALLMSGYEETREDLQGLSAALWAKLCLWSFRLTVLLGLLLMAMVWHASGNPFQATPHLYWKLPLVILLLIASESSPKTLAQGKRGAPLLALALFLLTTFVTVNRTTFEKKAPSPLGSYEAGTIQKAR
jgi:hypothetical protein